MLSGLKMEKASTDVTQLSELIEKPSNLDRWRLLPGRDNTYHELTGKALAIEEFLSAKEDQAYEKDLVLEEVSFHFTTNHLMQQLTFTTGKRLLLIIYVSQGKDPAKKSPFLYFYMTYN